MTVVEGEMPIRQDLPRARKAPQRDSSWQWLRQTLRTGGPGQCIFAITNACNANCAFCGFALDKLARDAWAFVDPAGARAAIDVLHRNFIRYLIVTGGEPLLHPELDEIVACAHERGISVLLVTNGSRLGERRCRELAAAGVSSVFISIDAPTAQAHECNRSLSGVCERIRAANEVFRSLDVQVTASVTLSRLVTDFDALAAFLRQLGFTSVTFSYPLTDLPSSFLGYANAPLVRFTAEELVSRFEAVKRLRRHFPVVNPVAGLEEMQRFVRGEPQHFECLGGYRYFYLDWNLQVWRCHHWEHPIGSILDLDESKYVRDGCTRCTIDCFRDSSVMQHVGVSVADAMHDARAGHPWRATKRLLRRSNLESLGAALQNRHWIRRL
ncbi:MAG TPA: radical SAM protein [Casimicrobiaceae bacterium]